MHRSGTSLLAQWLAQAGLPLTVGGTIAPDVSNQRGYYEDLEFVRLHAAHLRGIQRRSFGWNYVPSDFLHLDESELAHAHAIIAARNQFHPAWGWKDPRTTLFLTDWKKVIPSLKVILVWRPCAEVVFSLITRGLQQRARRLLIGPLQAIRLWRIYNQLACDYKMRFPDDTVIVSSSQLPEHSDVVWDRLTTQFGLDLSPVSAKDWFVPSLMHHQPSRGLQWLCERLGCGPIEKQLQALSVWNPLASSYCNRRAQSRR